MLKSLCPVCMLKLQGVLGVLFGLAPLKPSLLASHLPPASFCPPRHACLPCFSREVETLFHEFGHAAQHMLTEQQEGLAAGIRGVEWDAVELPSQVGGGWCWCWCCG